MTKDYIEAVYDKHNKWLAAGKYEHMTKDYIDYIEAVYDKHTTYGLQQGNMST